MASVILPPVPSVARFAIKGTFQGQPFVNVIHAQYTQAPADPTAMGAICQQVHAAYVNAFTTVQSTDIILNEVDGQDLASRTAATGLYAQSHTATGGAGWLAPVSLCICVSWSISERYRGGHPRNYLPGLLSTDMQNGRLLSTTGHTKWLNAAAAFLTDINAMTGPSAPFRMCCVRYFMQHQLQPVPPVRLISGQAVHQRVDSQRRRLGKEVA